MIENRYKEHYKPDAYISGRGRVVEEYLYQGDFYILPLSKQERKKAGRINVLLSLLMLVLFVLTGVINNAGSRKFYILLPYICIFMPAFYMLFGAVSFLGAPERMQIAHYDRTLCRSRRSCIGIMVLSAIIALIDIIFLIINREEILVIREIFFLGGMVFMILLGIVYGKFYQRMFGNIAVEKAEEAASGEK